MQLRIQEVNQAVLAERLQSLLPFFLLINVCLGVNPREKFGWHSAVKWRQNLKDLGDKSYRLESRFSCFHRGQMKYSGLIRIERFKLQIPT